MFVERVNRDENKDTFDATDKRCFMLIINKAVSVIDIPLLTFNFICKICYN